MNAALQQGLIASLEWQLENGVDIALDQAAVNRFKAAPPPLVMAAEKPTLAKAAVSQSSTAMGTGAAKAEAIKLAQAAKTLEELSEAIRNFDGLAIRKTATNLVFSDGNPKAHVMIVGEAPGADEDAQGKPFVGVSGQLMDKMLAAIGLNRHAEDPAKAVYISNILNWRPPGNRTPTPQEMDIALAFIERHIALVKPKVLLLMGGVATKALMNTNDGIMKLRGKWYEYQPITPDIGGISLPVLPSYHPSFLLRTPSHKKSSWADMLALKEKLGL